ncbi:MAG: gliding motility lipoprotein GldH [Flavobacteriaceae bacterium]|nr:gliding motility lipoprotein GldH [Flavobacteriaceae bacterium]
MHKFLSVLFLVLFLVACSDAKVFNQYKTIADAQWHKDSIINFKFSPEDTLSRKSLYINLRTNKDYEFSNLFLIVGIKFPNSTNIIDTLEYEMTDAQGNFLGTGFTDLKENKLEYKTDVIFPLTGEYHINVQQAMRKSGDIEGITSLKGITDVGVSIEKQTNE